MVGKETLERVYQLVTRVKLGLHQLSLAVMEEKLSWASFSWKPRLKNVLADLKLLVMNKKPLF